MDRSPRVRRRQQQQVLARARRGQDAVRQLREDRLERPDPGQDFPTSAAATSEYEKLVREKRKKGYTDAGGGGGGGGDEDDEDDEDKDDADDEGGDDDEPAPKKVTKPITKPVAATPAAARPAGQRMVLESGNRKVEAYLSIDGKTLRMDSIETYATPEAAKKAHERLKKMLAGEGYKDS